MIHVGCCGFPVSRRRYFELFKVVEVQQTFYQVPKRETLVKWREEAPKDFEYIIKAWQGITHPLTSPTWRRYKGELWGSKENYGLLKYTNEVLKAWEITVSALDALKGDKVVIQLPPKLEWNNQTKDDIKKTLTEFSKYNVVLIVEPRHESWLNSEVETFFKKLKIVHCVDPFKNIEFKTSNLVYYRLHGINGYKYSYKYTDSDLRKLLERVYKAIEGCKIDAYVMFNNKYMFDDALRFIKLIRKLE